MALIFVRTAIIFLALLVVMRMMGKSQIGEMQPFELVITLLIAELACIPMADTSVPLMYGIISIAAMFILHQIVWLLNLCAKPFKTLVSGRPSLVITKQGIDEYQLKKNNLDVCDLIESMRAAGYFNLDDVYYGLYEANGGFSALGKEEKNRSLAVTIIDSGKINAHNLEMSKLTREKLDGILESRNTKVKKVLVMTVDGNGRIYLQRRGKPYEILHAEGTAKW